MLRETLTIKGFQAPGLIRTHRTATQFNSHPANQYSRRKTRFHSIQYGGCRRNYSDDFQLFLKGQPIVQKQVIQSQFVLICHKDRPNRCRDCFKETSQERRDNLNKLTLVCERAEQRDRSTFPSITPCGTQTEKRVIRDMNKIGNKELIPSEISKVTLRKRNRFTKSRKATNVQQSNIPQDLRTHQFFQTQKHGGDFQPIDPSLIPQAEGNKNGNNPRDPKKGRLGVNLRRHLESLAGFVHFNNISKRDGNNHLPVLKGFPAHCTDTLLIKILMEMSKMEQTDELVNEGK